MTGIWLSEMQRNWSRKTKLVLYLVIFILLAANMWGLTSSPWGQYRFGEGKILLSNLNASWFFMNGPSLLLISAFLPALYIESMGGELQSGRYRLYMLRPYKRYQLWLGKLLALAATTAIIVAVIYMIGVIGAQLLFPHQSTTTLYLHHVEVGEFQAHWYTIKFYLLFLLVCWAKLLFCSAVCMFISRPLVAFLVQLILSFVIYRLIAREMVIQADPFQQILLALQHDPINHFWTYLVGSSIILAVISFVSWQRKIV